MQVGLVFFGLFSAAAAWSHSTGTLIATRALMGVAAAFIFPASLAILTSVFPDPSERQKALGIWGATSGIAVAFGPIVGGALLEHFWYGSIFLVNVPIVVVTLVAGGLLIPRLPKVAPAPLRHPGRADLDGGDHDAGAGHHRGAAVGLGLGGHAGLLRRRRGPADRLHIAGAAHRGTAARRPGLQDPALHRRRAVHLGGVLLPLRVHLPHHPVLPVRQGLLDALGRPAHAAVRDRRRRVHADRRGGGAEGGDAPRRDDGAAADGSRPRRGGLQLSEATPPTGGRSSWPWCCWRWGSPPSRRRRRRRSWARWPTSSAAPPPASTTRPGSWAGTLGVAVFGSIFASSYAPQIISAFRSLPIPAGPKAEAHQSMAAALAVVAHAPRAARPALRVDRLHGVPQRAAGGLHRGRRRGGARRAGCVQAPARAGCPRGGARPGRAERTRGGTSSRDPAYDPIAIRSTCRTSVPEEPTPSWRSERSGDGSATRRPTGRAARRR